MRAMNLFVQINQLGQEPQIQCRRVALQEDVHKGFTKCQTLFTNQIGKNHGTAAASALCTVHVNSASASQCLCDEASNLREVRPQVSLGNISFLDEQRLRPWQH
mmetsp:Transcript_79783/g.222078  ORF Transcript_79783/g.222078 Transcript_79783/m.222078 type:complete len:104 (+) Transcript_79783:491-802(+)